MKTRFTALFAFLIVAVLASGCGSAPVDDGSNSGREAFGEGGSDFYRQ